MKAAPFCPGCGHWVESPARSRWSLAAGLRVVVALTFASAPGKSMAIIGPPSQALAVVVRANGRVLASNDYVTIARSDNAGFVGRLYAAGALLVLDAEQAGGCSGLRRPKRIAKPRRSRDGGAAAATTNTSDRTCW